MAAIGHLIRCLFKRGRQIANYGLVKASWIASVFGVAERSVHSARKWLTREGFLTQERVHQLVMNRWGGKFLINLAPKLAGRRGLANGFAPPVLTKPLTGVQITRSGQIEPRLVFEPNRAPKRDHGQPSKTFSPRI
jgi:hypothetical protein